MFARIRSWVSLSLNPSYTCRLRPPLASRSPPSGRGEAYSTGFHSIGISRYPVAVFSTWATDGNG